MKTSTVIARRVKKECDTAFGVTGGNIINIVDSLDEEDFTIIPMHHEQSAAIAADAYARFKGFGVCFATSGPGITNLITGTACSYFDSVPVLAIGGQVPSKLLEGSDRQTGFQEVDGVSLMRPVTKFSKRYKNYQDLELCINTIKNRRRGPGFIEIPDDVQRIEITESDTSWDTNEDITPIYMDTERWEKPIVIVGSGAMNAQLDLKIPFLCTWGTKDRLINHPYCVGDFGITGSRHGNQLLKEADLIIMLGTRMDTHQVPDWNIFAPLAHKIAIGLEFPHTVAEFVETNLNIPISVIGKKWCSKGKNNDTDSAIYKWVDDLSEMANKDDIIIPDMGQTGCIVLQRWGVKDGQRLFNGMNHSPMGYALPGAIGASIATGRRIIVIIGEGSLMMNLQDLQTISDLNLPINIFVVKNGGYGMIRQTQDDWKQYLNQGVACNFNTPDIRKLANAFDIEYTSELKHRPTISEHIFEDTRIQPKWKYGEAL